MIIKASNESTDTEWSDTSFLSILLFCFGNMLGNIFDWWIIIIIQSVRLTFDSGFIGEDSTIGCKTRKCQMNMLVELNDLLNSSSFLKFSDCFFLNINMIFTSTAKTTDEFVTNPTEHKPFFTASIAYSTWKR